MTIVIKKKERETTASLLRRFGRRVQQSRILLEARKNRFFIKKKNRRQVREGAMRREILRQERTRLTKLGLLEEGQPIPKERIRRLQQEGRL